MTIRDEATGLPGTVHLSDTPADVADTVATWLGRLTDQHGTVGGGRAFSIALAGGSTPKLLYHRLARTPHRESIDWSLWQVFYGDERACPADDAQSNHHLAMTELLEHVGIPAQRVHRMPADEPDLEEAAAKYAALLQALLPSAEGPPRLEAVLLGLGTNGHTASLFPGTAALKVTDRWVAVGEADYAPFQRLTLTYPVLNAATEVAFMVTGSEKGEALRGVRDGTVPAAGVSPVSGGLHWFLDRAAADSIG